MKVTGRPDPKRCRSASVTPATSHPELVPNAALNRDDLATLYATHRMRFRGALRNRFARWDGANALTADDVEAAVHDAFARILCLYQAGTTKIQSPAAYILTVARNSCVDMVRRRNAQDLAAATESLANTVCPHHCGETEDCSLDVQQGVVTRYLARAPDALLDVYAARFVDGLSQSRTAQCLGISRKQVRIREAALVNGLRAHCASLLHQRALTDEQAPNEKLDRGR
jgi:RNA polymerase sigma factor (sigma-70 family)